MSFFTSSTTWLIQFVSSTFFWEPSSTRASVFLDLDIFSHFGRYQQQTIAADEQGRMMVEVFFTKISNTNHYCDHQLWRYVPWEMVSGSSFFVLIPQLFLYDGANIRNIICWFFKKNMYIFCYINGTSFITLVDNYL